MASSSYEPALARLLAHEGGYTDHPADPGGPTNFGITIADYRKYVKPDATVADVEAMREDEAKTIYRERYWDAIRCDDLPAGVDYAVFDYGVNSGIGRAGKVLRRCLHLADNSARVTDAVIAATRAADVRSLIASISDERLAFLKSLKTWEVFGRGWARRVDEVRTEALAMAAPPPPAPKPSMRGTAAVAAAAVSAGGAAHSAGLPLWATSMLVIAAALLAIVAVRFIRKGKA